MFRSSAMTWPIIAGQVIEGTLSVSVSFDSFLCFYFLMVVVEGRSEEKVVITARGVVLIEGLHALYFPEVVCYPLIVP